jgi:hypothetical protein
VKGKDKEETIPTIEIDRRAKLLELRRVVGAKLKASPDTFQLRREVRGPELKNNKKSLAAFLFRDDGRVFVDLEKRPTEMGSFSILVSVLCPDKNSSPFFETVRKVENGSFLEIVVKKEEKSEEKSKEKKEKSEKKITKCTRDSTCRCELCLNSQMILPDQKAKMTAEKTKSKAKKESMMTTRLGNLKVQSNMSNEELKRAIMDKFQSTNLLPPSIERMRLRGLDSGRRRLSKVYFDNRTLIKNNAKLRDGTEIVVQPCKSEDHVTEKSLLIVVRRFRENDLVMEPKVEIAIDKTATVQDLENKLKKLSGLSDIVMAKPFPYQLLSVKTVCTCDV